MAPIINKEKFFEKIKSGKFSQKEGVVANAILVISQYKDMRLTVRQIFYRLVATGKIKNNVAMYHLLVNALTWARRGHLINYDSIEDRTRAIGCEHKNETPTARHVRNHFSYLINAHRYYSLPLWWGQKTRVIVMLEKQALASVFEKITKPLEVDLVVCRGYPSLTLLYEMYKRLRNEDNEIKILYFGDYDPSGADIQRSLEQTLREDFYMEFDIERVAITREQIDELNIPPAPAKASDSRTKAFAEREGVSWQVELDAIEPTMLSKMIEDNIMKFMDSDIRLKRDLVDAIRVNRIEESVKGIFRPDFNLDDLLKQLDEADKKDLEDED